MKKPKQQQIIPLDFFLNNVSVLTKETFEYLINFHH